jgi:hypothetical protein
MWITHADSSVCSFFSDALKNFHIIGVFYPRKRV